MTPDTPPPPASPCHPFQSSMPILGLTGGIAAGKPTVAVRTFADPSKFRTLVPEYIKAHVPLNLFVA